jgi:hypothetical protein
MATLMGTYLLSPAHGEATTTTSITSSLSAMAR